MFFGSVELDKRRDLPICRVMAKSDNGEPESGTWLAALGCDRKPDGRGECFGRANGRVCRGDRPAGGCLRSRTSRPTVGASTSGRRRRHRSQCRSGCCDPRVKFQLPPTRSVRLKCRLTAKTRKVQSEQMSSALTQRTIGCQTREVRASGSVFVVPMQRLLGASRLTDPSV